MIPRAARSIPTSGQTTYRRAEYWRICNGDEFVGGDVQFDARRERDQFAAVEHLVPGQTLWLTWQMGVGGSGQGLGIDNLSFSASNVAGSPTLIWAVGSGVWDNSTPNWTGTSTTFTNASNNASFGTIAADTAVTVQAAGVNVASSVTINNTGVGVYTFGGGGIGGAAASLNINGGTVKLTSTSNSYGLATNINAGTLIVNDNRELGATSAALNLAGGTLKLAATVDAGTRVLTVAAAGGTIDTGGFGMTLGATMHLGAGDSWGIACNRGRESEPGYSADVRQQHGTDGPPGD